MQSNDTHLIASGLALAVWSLIMQNKTGKRLCVLLQRSNQTRFLGGTSPDSTLLD